MKRGSGVTFWVALAMVASWVATPAWAQDSGYYAVQGAKIYTWNEAPIESGTVIIRDGKIVSVEAGVSAPSGAQVIDATGLQVYPGLFDAMTEIGLTEVGSVPATVDTTDLGRFNPQLEAAVAIHPASDLIPVARANGITHAVSAPGGGGASGAEAPIIAGQASAIHLAGWTVEEMAIERSMGMALHWPRIETETFDFSTFATKETPYEEAKKAYDEEVAEIESWFEAARHYRQAVDNGNAARFERDLKLEAMRKVIDGELPLIVYADEDRQIRAAVEFAETQGLRMILAGGSEAWKVKDLLADKTVPVILGPTQALPREEDEPYDKPFTCAAELHSAGVKIAFGTFGASNSRTLPYEVGNAVAFGLPWEEGLKAITLYPAQILGVDDRLGSVEEGKVANLIVTDGDPLEIQTEVKYLFINGRLTDPDNKHKRLYEKYRARP